MSDMLHGRADYQQMLQVSVDKVAGGSQTVTAPVGGPESAQHLRSIPSTYHSCQNCTLATLIAVTSSAGPDWVRLVEGGHVWVEVSQ